MSAPDTNIEKQAARHWPSIIGICVALALGVAVGLFIASVTDVDGPSAGAALVGGEVLPAGPVQSAA